MARSRKTRGSGESAAPSTAPAEPTVAASSAPKPVAAAPADPPTTPAEPPPEEERIDPAVEDERRRVMALRRHHPMAPLTCPKLHVPLDVRPGSSPLTRPVEHHGEWMSFAAATGRSLPE